MNKKSILQKLKENGASKKLLIDFLNGNKEKANKIHRKWAVEKARKCYRNMKK